MSKRFRSGLVVGKFSPLHRGHEFLIESALADCQAVLVLSYSRPELPGCGCALRDRWLKRRFPQARVQVFDEPALQQLCAAAGGAPLALPANEAADAEQREFVARLCLDVLRLTVDAVFTSEDYGDGFAQVLTQAFQARAHQHPPVRHVCVDRARSRFPVSGSQLRADPRAATAWMDARIAREFQLQFDKDLQTGPNSAVQKR